MPASPREALSHVCQNTVGPVEKVHRLHNGLQAEDVVIRHLVDKPTFSTRPVIFWARRADGLVIGCVRSARRNTAIDLNDKSLVSLSSDAAVLLSKLSIEKSFR